MCTFPLGSDAATDSHTRHMSDRQGFAWPGALPFPSTVNIQPSFGARIMPERFEDVKVPATGRGVVLRRVHPYVSMTTIRSSEARSFLTAMAAVGKAARARATTAADWSWPISRMTAPLGRT